MAGRLGSIGSFLGKNAGTLGPLASTLGGVVSGAIGSNAAGNASAQQAEALNRGIDLSTAQWLQQQQNLAPYLQAGQQGLSQLQSLMGREQPALPGGMASIDPRQYGMPGATPTWAPAQYRGPGAVQAANYNWTPGQGPQAQDYRYTPGQTPDAANYRYTAGAVPTLSGQELLANDPGYQFRMDEARKALEGSAAARGDLLSGGNLKALQSRSQDLASQEYGKAWNRASQQAQLREQWGQAESQMGWQQAEAATRLREQVNQIARQQGWSQAQAEAAFREQMAQQSSAQNFGPGPARPGAGVDTRALRRSRTGSASSSSGIRRITTVWPGKMSRSMGVMWPGMSKTIPGSRTCTGSNWRNSSCRGNRAARWPISAGKRQACTGPRERMPHGGSVTCWPSWAQRKAPARGARRIHGNRPFKAA